MRLRPEKLAFVLDELEIYEAAPSLELWRPADGRPIVRQVQPKGVCAGAEVMLEADAFAALMAFAEVVGAEPFGVPWRGGAAEAAFTTAPDGFDRTPTVVQRGRTASPSAAQRVRIDLRLEVD